MTPHRFAFAIAIFVLASAAAGQPLRIHAYASLTEPGVADEVLLTVEIAGSFADIGSIELPETRNLALWSSTPARQAYTSTRRGRTESVVRLQWSLRPIRAGEAEIGAVEMLIDGRRYRTEPIRIRVRPTHRRAPDADRSEAAADPSDIFLRAVADRSTAYVGQQVVVDYILYYSEDVQARNARAAAAWDAPGLWREDMNVGAPVPTRDVVIDGRSFRAATIRRVAFFPTRTGEVEISPLEVEIDVLRARGIGGLPYNVFGHRFRQETIVAPAVPLDVRPLPPSPPEGFSGAAGRYQMTVETQAGAGDRLQVTVRLVGDGNPATIDPPAWSLPDEVTAYRPARSTTVDRGGTRMSGTHVFTFTAEIPSQALAEIASPTWTYFDTESRSYRTLAGEAIRLDLILAPRREADHDVHTAAFELRSEVARWRPRTPFVARHRRAETIAALLVPGMMLLMVVAARLRRDRELARGAGSATGAAERASRALGALERSDYSDPQQTARVVERTLRAFLGERLEEGLLALSLGRLHETLRAHGVSEPARQHVLDVLTSCEALQFAPAATATAVDVRAVGELIDAIDAEAKPVTR